MPEFYIVVHDDVLREHLALLTERLQDLEPPLREIATIVTEYITQNFEDADVLWPPLSPNTVRLKEAMGYPADPLVRTGAMRGAATDSGGWEISRAGRGWVAKLEVPGYSDFHFSGTRFMPMRDYALLRDTVEGDVLMALEAHLFAGLGA